MEQKMIIDKIIKGQLATAYDLINKNALQFSTNDGIKLFSWLCRVCNENLTTPERIDENDLCRLTLCFLEFVKTPSNVLIENYLRSLFFIIKLLLVKETLDKIVELKPALIAGFLPKKLIDEEHVYEASCISIYNKIVSKSRIKDQNCNDNLLNLSHLLIEMYARLGDKKQYLENLHNCGLTLEFVGINCELLHKFYNEIVEIMAITSERFEIILKIFTSNFNNLINHERSDVALDFYQNFIKLLKNCDQTKEFDLLKQLLEIYQFLITKDDRILQSSHNSMKSLYEHYNNSNNFQIVCTSLSTCIVNITKLFIKNPTKYWRFIENLQYYRFVCDLALVLSQSGYKCSCIECGVTTKIYDAYTVINTIQQLGKLFIINAKDCRDCLKELQVYVEKSLKLVAALKEKNCDRWKHAWCDCGKFLFNTGKDLPQIHSDDRLKFLKIFVKYSIKFEGYTATILKNYQSCALIDIAKIYFHQKKKYEKSLAITAFNIHISLAHRSKIVLNWLKYKADCRSLDILSNTTIQELTIPTILENNQHDILYYDPKFQLTKQQKLELLTIELQNYKESWKSKIPMMVTFRELYEINDNIIELVDVFIEIWGDGDLNVHEKLSKFLPLLLKKYQQSNDNNKIKLAHLHYLQHKYCLKDAITQTTDDMNKTVNLNLPTITTATNPDSDEQCDLVASYANLKLNRYSRTMRGLNNAFDILNTITEPTNHDKVYCLLKRIGHEYRLHSNLMQLIKTWQSALKIATINNDNLQIMESTGFLIEFIDVKQQSTIINEYIVKADEIADNLDINQYLNEIITYYLCKSSSYYYSGDVEESYRIFCDKIQKFANKFDDNYLMKSRITLLHHKLLLLPCKYQIDGHHDLSKIHQAYKDVLQHYYAGTTSNDSSYEMSLFFEITEEIARTYHNLRMPREVRCYCKEVVLVAQKLLLPYRTLMLLYYLAYADILSTRLDDCKVKINGISDILCLQTKPTSPISKKLQQQQYNAIIDRLTIEFSEIMLDVPVRTTIQQHSPNLQIDTFQLPLWLFHQQNCDCYQCVSLEFPQFVLKKTLLDILLNVYQKNTTIARDYCCGGIKIHELIRNKQQQMINTHTNCLLPNIVDLNLNTYNSILLEYGNIFLRAKEIDKAKRINGKLYLQLKHNRLDCYLKADILMQKLTILLMLSSSSSSSTTVKVDAKTDNSTIENDGPKTPESLQNPVTIPFKFTPQRSPSPLPKKPITTIQFNLDDDDDDNDNKDKDNDNKVMKNRIYNRLFDEEKTPAPSISKRRIHNTRSAVNKQDNNKKVSEEPSNSSCSVIQMSPDAYTPSVKQDVRTNLSNRTKLLTERLRSQKKVNSTNNGDEGAVPKSTRKLRYN